LDGRTILLDIDGPLARITLNRPEVLNALNLAWVTELDEAATALAARPDVRAVHAAPAGVTARELALSPLLPEQVERADPPPDDGPVPS
jgi:hypothetical protein